MHRLLWVVQILLALLFLFAGGMKLVMPAEQLTAQMQLSAAFLRFIAVVEILGALGLVLPGLLHTRTFLTPLAAAGLTIIMIGAVALTFHGGVQMAGMPFVTGLLTLWVAFARWRQVPLH